MIFLISNVIIKNLSSHYQDYCNYDEILCIDKKDRLSIMQFIWNRWAVHISSVAKELKYTYFYYDKDWNQKLYKITNEQLEAIETVLERGEDSDFIAPTIYGAELDYVVELYEYSHDGLFKRDTKLALGVMNDLYYVLQIRSYDEAVDVYIASYDLQDVFEETMEKYNSYLNYEYEW